MKIGVVFQGYNLLFSRTALGNVMLPLEIQGFSKDKAQRKALSFLAWLAFHTEKTLGLHCFQAVRSNV